MPFRTTEVSVPVGGVKVADGDDAQSILVVNTSAVPIKAFGREQEEAGDIAYADPGLTIEVDASQGFVLSSHDDELWLSSSAGTVDVEVALG